MQPCWTLTRQCSRTPPWPSKMAAQSHLDTGQATEGVLAAWQPLTEESKLHVEAHEADMAAIG